SEKRRAEKIHDRDLLRVRHGRHAVEVEFRGGEDGRRGGAEQQRRNDRQGFLPGRHGGRGRGGGGVQKQRAVRHAQWSRLASRTRQAPRRGKLASSQQFAQVGQAELRGGRIAGLEDVGEQRALGLLQREHLFLDGAGADQLV